MVSPRTLLLIALAALLPAPALSQSKFQTTPIPSDPFELATGPIEVVDSPEERVNLRRLFEHARHNYQIQSAGQGFELKVSFLVDSEGQMQYDGMWNLDETFRPGLGRRWTATAAAGYSTTRLDVNGLHYADGSADLIPLALHEARGALLGPMGETETLDHQLIRTATATLEGTPLTCILHSDLGVTPAEGEGRGWKETEECIDSQSGLLHMRSLVPGRYEIFDYTDAAEFHGHILPRKVTITEAGKPVIKLQVESLKDIAAPDPALFAITETMKSTGPATILAGAKRFSIFHDRPRPNMVLHPVVVFGLLTPEGKILDAHSLQPSDPHSEEAVQAAAKLGFHDSTPPGGTPMQREVAVIVEFASGQ
jgi:hypothetical protein